MEGEQSEHPQELIEQHESILENLSKNLDLVKYNLGMKNIKNGERDKLLDKLENKVDKIGDKTEQEDKTLFEHIIDIKTSLENKADNEHIINIKTSLGDKADKKELPPNWIIYLNTVLLGGFFLIIFYNYARESLPKLLGFC